MTTNYKRFAESAVLIDSDSEYDNDRAAGHIADVAQAAFANKLGFQASTMIEAIATWLDDDQVSDVLDSDTNANLVAIIKAAIDARATTISNAEAVLRAAADDALQTNINNITPSRATLYSNASPLTTGQAVITGSFSDYREIIFTAEYPAASVIKPLSITHDSFTGYAATRDCRIDFSANSNPRVDFKWINNTTFEVTSSNVGVGIVKVEGLKN